METTLDGIAVVTGAGHSLILLVLEMLMLI